MASGFTVYQWLFAVNVTWETEWKSHFFFLLFSLLLFCFCLFVFWGRAIVQNWMRSICADWTIWTIQSYISKVPYFTHIDQTKTALPSHSSSDTNWQEVSGLTPHNYGCHSITPVVCLPWYVSCPQYASYKLHGWTGQYYSYQHYRFLFLFFLALLKRKITQNVPLTQTCKCCLCSLQRCLENVVYNIYKKNAFFMHYMLFKCQDNCCFSALTFQYVTNKFIALVQQKQLKEQRWGEYSIMNPGLFILVYIWSTDSVMDVHPTMGVNLQMAGGGQINK